jgi:hypothetical protein
MTTIGKLGAAGRDGMTGAADSGLKHAGMDQSEVDLSLDSELERVLGDFRASVHAWSEAASNRPRTVLDTGRQTAHRRPLAWAVGCLMMGVLAFGGVKEMEHRLNAARAEALRQVEQQRLMLEERTRESEDLLAKVDSDIAREAPDALEPLAQLMADDEAR